MPSPRRIINESPAEIARLVGTAAYDAERTRIGMLRLFAENPARSFADVAQRIGVSERTIKRWWQVYRSDGLAGLIRRSGERPGRAAATTADAGGDRSSADTGIMPEHVIEFLNALPPRGDEPLSATRFRNALLKLLPDVDHISVTVNRACDLTAKGLYQPGVAVSEHVGSVPKPLMANRQTAADEMETSLIDNYRHQGFPIERYRSAHSFIYHLSDGAYLGAIFLWREKQNPRVTAHTLDFMERLHPYFEFLLTDLVARFRYSDPIGASYIEAIEELSASIGLTPPEQQVVVMLAEGYTQKVMAERLMISPHTVQAHMKSVFKKAGVHSATELMARYLTPGRKRSPAEPDSDTGTKEGKGTRPGRK